MKKLMNLALFLLAAGMLTLAFAGEDHAATSKCSNGEKAACAKTAATSAEKAACEKACAAKMASTGGHCDAKMAAGSAKCSKMTAATSHGTKATAEGLTPTVAVATTQEATVTETVKKDN